MSPAELRQGFDYAHQIGLQLDVDWETRPQVDEEQQRRDFDLMP